MGVRSNNPLMYFLHGRVVEVDQYYDSLGYPYTRCIDVETDHIFLDQQAWLTYQDDKVLIDYAHLVYLLPILKQLDLQVAMVQHGYRDN